MIAVVSAQPHLQWRYNISIAPLFEAIEKADALYREWHTVLDDLQAPTRGVIKIRGTQDAVERAVIAMWKDREPSREFVVRMDPHMTQLLLDEIIGIVRHRRPDLRLEGSTSVTSAADCGDFVLCAYQRQSLINIAYARDAEPQTNDDLPLGDPYVLCNFTDEEMRARWYCCARTWRQDGHDGEECSRQQDSPPAAVA